MQIAFDGLGFSRAEPIGLVRRGERTLFASTAGQTFDDLIYSRKAFDSTQARHTVQPVVRLQSNGVVDRVDGFSTSFLHAATETWRAQIPEHIITLDNWLSFLSSIGLYVGSLCLVMETATNHWADKVVVSRMVRLNYLGLELGVANFFESIALRDKSNATLSEVGVGVERVLWAINKLPSYFQSIGPIGPASMLPSQALDSLRTGTLMFACGVDPGHHSHGSKLRSILRTASPYAYLMNVHELSKYYYDFWCQYVAPVRSFDDLYRDLMKELHRQINSTVIGSTNFSQRTQSVWAMAADERFPQNAIQARLIAPAELFARLRSMTKHSKDTRLFLGGGGSATQSQELDREFVRQIDVAKPLVYIPNAMEARRHPSSFRWIRSVMAQLGLRTVVMWNTLEPDLAVSEIGAVYIGGGDTQRLLLQVRESGFSRYLKRAFMAGVPIYGGSAGAILLGRDIRTAPEAAACHGPRAKGLSLVPGLSIVCHYDGRQEELKKTASRLKHTVLAIPETAGVFIQNDLARPIGDSVALVVGGKLRVYKPDAAFRLKA